MIRQIQLTLPPFHRGMHLITHHISDALSALPETGILNIFIHHTSAGLTINENADPSVREDLESFFNHLIPEGWSGFTHTFEGSDDMPAHIKSTLTSASVNIPVSGNRLGLGNWQGVYLCEFRNRAGGRKITLTLMSD